MVIRSPAASALLKPIAAARTLPRPTRSLPHEVLRLCQIHQRTRHLPAQAQPRRHYASSPSSSSPAADLNFGQPVHETHPHILAAGELTPSITAQEYHARRAALAALLPPDSVAILPAATVKWRSGAVFHPFRQESNFLYLTGFSEPESLAVIHKPASSSSSGNDNYIFHLYVRPKDPALELWSGPWSGVDAAEDVFNADIAGALSDAGKSLASILQPTTKIYTDAAADELAPYLQSSSSTRSPLKKPTTPLKALLNTLRVTKSPAELSAMRHAGRVSGRALTAAMRRAWTLEKDLAAYLDHAFTADGLSGPAYVPVVAGGSRANMIHYVHNSRALDPSELVLVDAGGEYGSYITDITRTWPVSGTFTSAQRDLYAAVLAVQRKGVAMCRADKGVSLDDIHRATEADLKKELGALGFDLGAPGAVGELFPHHVGHYVGLDVHDCPGYARHVALKKGMCVTVEPGVYVPDDERWPKHFRGMGIRIEDSVAVDDEGPIVLSVEAVKEIVDIEALRS